MVTPSLTLRVSMVSRHRAQPRERELMQTPRQRIINAQLAAAALAHIEGSSERMAMSAANVMMLMTAGHQRRAFRRSCSGIVSMICESYDDFDQRVSCSMSAELF